MSDGSGFDQNVNIFDTDIKSSVHTNNNKMDLLSFDKGLKNDSGDSTMIAGKQYFIYFNILKVLLSNKRNFVWFCIVVVWIVMNLLPVLKYANLKQKILK